MAGKVLVPPTFKKALLATVSEPPALARLTVKAARSNIPPDTRRSPMTIALAFKVTVPAELATVRLLKLVANVPPIAWAVVPLKVTMAVPAVKAAGDTLFVQFPMAAIAKLFAFRVPALIKRLPLIVMAAGKRRPSALLSVKL